MDPAGPAGPSPSTPSCSALALAATARGSSGAHRSDGSPRAMDSSARLTFGRRASPPPSSPPPPSVAACSRRERIEEIERERKEREDRKRGERVSKEEQGEGRGREDSKRSRRGVRRLQLRFSLSRGCGYIWNDIFVRGEGGLVVLSLRGSAALVKRKGGEGHRQDSCRCPRYAPGGFPFGRSSHLRLPYLRNAAAGAEEAFRKGGGSKGGEPAFNCAGESGETAGGRWRTHFFSSSDAAAASSASATSVQGNLPYFLAAVALPCCGLTEGRRRRGSFLLRMGRCR